MDASDLDDAHGHEKALDQKATQDSLPTPLTTFNLYRRGPFGKKHFFVPASSSDPSTEPTDVEASYFIKNPVPQKHASSWKPVLRRGDNPKTFQGGQSIARARRTGFWNSFRIDLGDGVDEVLANEKRACAKTWHRRKQKWRKAFCMGEKPPKKPLEEQQEVLGFVMALVMRRKAFVNRTLRFEWAGEEYRWCGTRRFLPGWSKHMKGVSHDFKLVNSNGDLVATFQKDRWVSYKTSSKPGTPHNKNKSFVGTLTIYPAAKRATTMDMRRHNSAGIQSKSRADKLDDLDHAASGTKGKLDKNVNLQGEHVGNLTEEVIAFTCWMVEEAEHRIRYKILDFLAEVGDAVGG